MGGTLCLEWVAHFAWNGLYTLTGMGGTLSPEYWYTIIGVDIVVFFHYKEYLKLAYSIWFSAAPFMDL